VRKTIKRASKRIVSKVGGPRQSRAQSTRPKGMVRMQSPSRAKDVDLEKGNAPKANIKTGNKTDSRTDGKAKRQAMQINPFI
jgi:hypothetical protein